MGFNRFSNRTKALAIISLGLSIASVVSYLNDEKNDSKDTIADAIVEELPTAVEATREVVETITNV